MSADRQSDFPTVAAPLQYL